MTIKVPSDETTRLSSTIGKDYQYTDNHYKHREIETEYGSI